jgi:hypothetical protein
MVEADTKPVTAYHYDPAGWNTATCEHCDGHILRRATSLPGPDGHLTDGRWRHVRNGLVSCYGPHNSTYTPIATPRTRPESEE